MILVKHLPSFKNRPTEVEAVKKTFDSSLPIQYHDMCPIHLTNDSTVEALNKMIPPESNLSPFSQRNFRPCIVINGVDSLKEENFDYVRFSDNIICKNVRLCTRCAIPTIDPDTGIKEDERTKILTDFRSPKTYLEKLCYGDRSLFGINLAASNSGEVKVGSSVDVSFKNI